MNGVNDTIVQMEPLRLITAKSKRFPEGNRAAFVALEDPLETLRGRRFYGVVDGSESGLEYHAGLVPADDAEERRFAERGFETREIAGGAWARVKLFDWTEKLDQIGPMFGSLMESHDFDSSRPQLEFYRSDRELHLLLPVASIT